MKTYNQILDAVFSLSLEDKQELLNELTLIVEEEKEDTPYEPDHHDEHRASEIRAIQGAKL